MYILKLSEVSVEIGVTMPLFMLKTISSFFSFNLSKAFLIVIVWLPSGILSRLPSVLATMVQTIEEAMLLTALQELMTETLLVIVIYLGT